MKRVDRLLSMDTIFGGAFLCILFFRLAIRTFFYDALSVHISFRKEVFSF